jgi:hypothetical protein
VRSPIIAVDPGTTESAYVVYRDSTPRAFGKRANDDLLYGMRTAELVDADTTLVIEMIASYGMPVGREVFETCVFIGKMIEAWRGPHALVYRRDVKLHLCGQARAKDANIRAALIDRFGPGKDKAIGTKKAPGPLYGVSADVWSALAVAVTYSDTQSLPSSCGHTDAVPGTLMVPDFKRRRAG